MNTLPSHLEGVSTVMFVDDTTLYILGHSTTDISIKLSCALATAHKWLLECGKDCHQRSCYPLKFISMVPHLTGSELLIPWCGNQWHSLLEPSILTLSAAKQPRGIGLLRRLSCILPRQDLCTMYNVYIFPHLTYVDAVWGKCTQVQSRV